MKDEEILKAIQVWRASLVELSSAENAFANMKDGGEEEDLIAAERNCDLARFEVRQLLREIDPEILTLK